MSAEPTSKPEENPVGANPFDQPDFNAVSFINNKFPTEQSLTDIDRYLLELVAEIQRVDKELLTAVRTQSMVGGKASDDLKMAKDAITGLFSKVKDIKTKAADSEAMVREICSDIKDLDNAKRHLTTSIKALKRIQMLESAVQKMQQFTKEKDYREAAQLLTASLQLIKHFEQQSSAPKVVSLVDQIKKIQSTLQTDILSQYGRISLEQAAPPKLKDACMVIDAVGSDMRQNFTKNFITQVMDTYKDMFHPGEEASRLTQVDKRYKWYLKRLQLYNDNLADTFPIHWCIPQEMTVEFCLRTNSDISTMVKTEQQSLDVALLIKTLTRTLDFEKDLSNRFRPKDPQLIAAMEPDEEPEEGTADAIRRKYLLKKAQQEKVDREAEAVQTHHKMKQYKYNGFIASAFEPVMHLYINHEDKAMKKTVHDLLNSEKWGQDDEDDGMGISNTAILQSGTDLLIYLREGLKRLASFARGQTMLEMHHVWRKHLSYYADRLSNTLQKEQNEAQEIQRACLIINTAEYFCHTIDHFSDQIKGRIDEIYKKQVSMEAAQETFTGVINKGIKCLILGIDSKLEPAFRNMLKIDWGNVTDVGDASPYVHEFEQMVAARYSQIAMYLTPTYLTSFSNKFGMYTSAKLMSLFYKTKRLSDMGGQQLLLDTQSLKSFLVDLPNRDCNSGDLRFSDRQLSRYTTIVQKEMRKAENVLKIVLTPLTGNVEHIILQYTDTIDRPSIPDFLRLMELKGLQKNDLKPLIDILARNEKVAKTDASSDLLEDLKFFDGKEEDTSLFADARKRIAGAFFKN